jgi:hypothetical protein
LNCTIWTPEAVIVDTQVMEPVNLRGIPKDRYQLQCSLCTSRKGACIQCAVRLGRAQPESERISFPTHVTWSERAIRSNFLFISAPNSHQHPTCRVAFHVTCAIDHPLRMEVVFKEDGSVERYAYCQRHASLKVRDGTKVRLMCWFSGCFSELSHNLC